MAKRWNQVKDCRRLKDANGNYLMAVTGEETDQQLREIALCIHQDCPAATRSPHCPFILMASLSSQPLEMAIKRMNRQDLLDLFKMEHECRSEVLRQNETAANRARL